MIQAPSWLPHQIRESWDNRRISAALRGLDGTEAIPVASPGKGEVDVQMLVCRRDAELAVLTLKSFLRHGGVTTCVTLTDDGSLDGQIRSWISDHLPGCRWLPRTSEDAKVEAFLRDLPELRALYHGSFSFARRLVHPFLFQAAEKVIQLDADTLFFGRPAALHDWVRSSGMPPVFLHDHANSGTVPDLVKVTFHDLTERFETGRSWRLPYYFFNAGLLAFRPCDMDIAIGERFLQWQRAVPPALREGEAGIWFGDWTREQTAFFFMFGLTEPPAEPFGPEYHLGLDTGKAFNHFMRHYLVQAPTLDALRSAVSALPRRRR